MRQAKYGECHKNPLNSFFKHIMRMPSYGLSSKTRLGA